MTDKLESFGFRGEDIGVGLLSRSTGLYRSPFDVLRSYISNEIDNDPEPSYVGSSSDSGFEDGDYPATGQEWIGIGFEALSVLASP